LLSVMLMHRETHPLTGEEYRATQVGRALTGLFVKDSIASPISWMIRLEYVCRSIISYSLFRK
jgi:hypothetical protein